MDRAQRIRVEILKRGLAAGRLELTFPDTNTALSFKMKLYQTLGKFKASDPVLQDFSEQMVIRLKKGSTIVTLEPRVDEAEEALLKQLGISEDDLLSDDEKALQSSISKLISL